MPRVELCVKAIACMHGRVALVRTTSETLWRFPSDEHRYGTQVMDRAGEIVDDQLSMDFEALSVVSQQERLEDIRHEYFVMVRGILNAVRIPRAAEGLELLLVTLDTLHLHAKEIDPYDLMILEHVLCTPDPK